MDSERIENHNCNEKVSDGVHELLQTYFGNLEYLDNLPEYFNCDFENDQIIYRFQNCQIERLKILTILYTENKYYRFINETFSDPNKNDIKFVKRLNLKFREDDSLEFAIERKIHFALSRQFIEMMKVIHYSLVMKQSMK